MRRDEEPQHRIGAGSDDPRLHTVSRTHTPSHSAHTTLTHSHAHKPRAHTRTSARTHSGHATHTGQHTTPVRTKRTQQLTQPDARARAHARAQPRCGYRPTCVGWNAESITPLCSVSGVCAAKLLTGTGRARSAVVRVQSRRQNPHWSIVRIRAQKHPGVLKGTQRYSRVHTGHTQACAAFQRTRGTSDCRAWLLRSISGFCMRSA